MRIPRTLSSMQTLISIFTFNRLHTLCTLALASAQFKQGRKKEVPFLKLLQFML